MTSQGSNQQNPLRKKFYKQMTQAFIWQISWREGGRQKETLECLKSHTNQMQCGDGGRFNNNGPLFNNNGPYSLCPHPFCIDVGTLLSRGGHSFSSGLNWADFVTCFGWQNVTEVMMWKCWSLHLKKPVASSLALGTPRLPSCEDASLASWKMRGHVDIPTASQH